MGLKLTGKGQQSHRMVILVAIFVLMTLLILYGSNNVIDEVYAPFHVATNHALRTTDLKKWSGREGYVPVYGNKSMTLHCHNCALVTSSSHVLGTGAGEEIDHTECVIRMNDAPTMGYETDVGNQTSLRVVAHSSVFRVVRRPKEFLSRADSNPVIIFWGPPNKIGKEAKGTLYRLIQRVSMTYSNLSCFSITANKMRRFDNHYYKPRGSDECLTYIQNEGGRRGNHHRFITEKQVFARWAKQYNITFVHPKW